MTDNDGATASDTETVTVLAPNQPPTAVIKTPVVTDLHGIRGQFDLLWTPRTTLCGMHWNFGEDGSASNTASGCDGEPRLRDGENLHHHPDGDRRKRIHQRTAAVTVTAPNQKPSAAFSSASSGPRAVVFDGTGSSDPEGEVR